MDEPETEKCHPTSAGVGPVGRDPKNPRLWVWSEKGWYRDVSVEGTRDVA